MDDNTQDRGSIDPLDVFFRDLRHCPRFTREEERVLAVRARRGDADAREQLILSQVPWAANLAKKHADKSGMKFEDLLGPALLGLIEGVDHFDPRRDSRLTTYVSFYIRRDILGAASHGRHLIRVPKHLYGKSPMKKRSAVSMAAAERVWQGPVSLSADTPGGAPHCWEDRALVVPDFVPQVVENLDRQECLWRCMFMFQQLQPRERDILFSRAMGKTLEVVGKGMGLSRERVRQIEQRALGRLRILMKKNSHPPERV